MKCNAGGGAKWLMSYTEVGWTLLGLLPPGGNKEYEGARACPRHLNLAVVSGLEGKSLISYSFGENWLLVIAGEVFSDSMLIILPFSEPIKHALLVAGFDNARCDLGPVTGSSRWLRIPNSFGPKIRMWCFRSHSRPCFAPKDVATVFDLRKSCNNPVINPDKFRTTVAIIASLRFPGAPTKDPKYGMTNA
jgi:hypothetical protein